MATNMESGQRGSTRREFVRKASYSTPLLLTLPALPSFAQQGSGAAGGGAACATGADISAFIDLLRRMNPDISNEEINAAIIAEFPGDICDS